MFSEEQVSKYQVTKRNGLAVPYDGQKVIGAVKKAVIAVKGSHAQGSQHLQHLAQSIVEQIESKVQRTMPDGGIIHIEDIQDNVELYLMRAGEQQVARAYVIYREEHSKNRQDLNIKIEDTLQEFTVVHRDNSETWVESDIYSLVSSACEMYREVSSERLWKLIKPSLYDGIKFNELWLLLIMNARSLIAEEPNYSKVAAHFLLNKLKQEVLTTFPTITQDDNLYRKAFRISIDFGIEKGILDNQLSKFDLEQLAEAILPERDRQFDYLGLQTLYDRYFLRSDETPFELPQVMFMRIAMGLAVNESQQNRRAIEFYRLLSSFDFMCSTPTLFNSGTVRPQLSSCYLTHIGDSLSEIYQGLSDNAMLSKWAGGLGNDWTPVRALGSFINGTRGTSQGIIPFLKVANDTAVAVNQGGKRKGAVCAYLETWHLDIEDFLELRKNTGDERRRTHDMNTANWIPDLFMKRVFLDQDWTLFSPSEVSDLHQLYGREFELRYEYYEELAQAGRLKQYKSIRAKELWQKMLSMLFETGHPWITFKDPCNVRSPQQHRGVVHSSNLCTEITLNTNDDEIAVCNLGSVNLNNHWTIEGIDKEHLKNTIRTAIRMLDNVIDLNFYPVKKAKVSNLKHRPIGLGMMGYQDVLYRAKISFDSIEAVELSDRISEAFSFYAIEASANLAVERGCYDSFNGSLWQQGIFPLDSLRQLEKSRGSDYCTFNYQSELDWSFLKEQVKKTGIRNSNIIAIAPTATIANIVGVCQSIEPTYQNLFVKSNLSGEFLVINKYLVSELKDAGLWDASMIDDIQYYQGDVGRIDRIPNKLKALFKTAFSIDPRWLVEAASRRQKWIDQAQSLNLYMQEPSGMKLDNLYKTAWSRGLKTTYYLRSLAATEVYTHSSDRVDVEAEQTLCRLDDLECEVCQ
ncbi:ribonucleoside-diphosphate reductase subunit alpha [Pleionea litopenaei]|uniref:Ribonucleoside-diphosphate reductase n=1 Tax=Pleionea litopenaei TaxID=3070815 RepID=A0AA51RQE2_9GAMM|nr:ribonucleoside-diphosphate reductase subunit alpha [Pleionea sp. HL-JVS1]WMS85728.1 ribonucleoside-diphosphate reductase subunit alpha [Pleionea sp. HL-JVS1]